MRRTGTASRPYGRVRGRAPPEPGPRPLPRRARNNRAGARKWPANTLDRPRSFRDDLTALRPLGHPPNRVPARALLRVHSRLNTSRLRPPQSRLLHVPSPPARIGTCSGVGLRTSADKLRIPTPEAAPGSLRRPPLTRRFPSEAHLRSTGVHQRLSGSMPTLPTTGPQDRRPRADVRVRRAQAKTGTIPRHCGPP